MLRVCVAVLSLCTSLPAWADARITILMDVMQMDEVVDILHSEGLVHGSQLDAEMLDGQGGPVWSEQVRNLYDRDRMQAVLRKSLGDGLEDAEIEAATQFFASQAGTAIVRSENHTRRVLMDPGIKTAAEELVAETKETNPEVYAIVTEFIEINDLIDNNVSGAMSQQYRFFKGLSDGGYNIRPDNEILDDVWSMQDLIAADTREWLYSYLVLAYLPLPQSDLEAYVAFSASDAGRALNSALFEAFDAVYRDISYGLGRAVALHAASDEI